MTLVGVSRRARCRPSPGRRPRRRRRRRPRGRRLHGGRLRSLDRQRPRVRGQRREARAVDLAVPASRCSPSAARSRAIGSGSAWPPSGDVNGDGIDDLALGADSTAAANSDAAYVIFGGASGELDTAALGARGYRILGAPGSVDRLLGGRRGRRRPRRPRRPAGRRLGRGRAGSAWVVRGVADVSTLKANNDGGGSAVIPANPADTTRYVALADAGAEAAGASGAGGAAADRLGVVPASGVGGVAAGRLGVVAASGVGGVAAGRLGVVAASGVGSVAAGRLGVVARIGRGRWPRAGWALLPRRAWAAWPRAGWALLPRRAWAAWPRAGWALLPRRAWAAWPRAGWALSPRRAWAAWPRAGWALLPRRAWAAWPRAGWALLPHRAWAAWPRAGLALSPRRAWAAWPRAGFALLPRRAWAAWPSGRLGVVASSGARGAAADVQVLAGVTAGERFGRQVANVGDVDGNGADDLVVGADMAYRYGRTRRG